MDFLKQLLLAPDIDVNLRSLGGDTPLMCATLSGDIYLVVECLNSNFNPFLENGIGMTALDYTSYYKGQPFEQNLLRVIQAALL